MVLFYLARLTLLRCLVVAGSGVDTGTACKLTKYNAAGDNVEDSIVTESSSLITVAGALDVDNICSNDASNNIKYGLNVGAGGISNTRYW